jgi:hypothetical protein
MKKLMMAALYALSLFVNPASAANDVTLPDSTVLPTIAPAGSLPITAIWPLGNSLPVSIVSGGGGGGSTAGYTPGAYATPLAVTRPQGGAFDLGAFENRSPILRKVLIGD